MDIFWKRRLIHLFTSFCSVLALSFFPGLASASTNASYDAAQAACEARIPYYVSMYGATGAVCIAKQVGSTGGEFYISSTYNGRLQTDGAFEFDGLIPVPTTDPCGSAWPTNTPPIWTGGKILSGSSMCRPGAPDPNNNGAQASCAVAISPIGPPVYDPNTGGWNTLVKSGGTGGICTTNGQPADANGKPITPVPTLPAVAPITAVPAPQICGGGSCYDPNSGNACAVDASGAQVCVPVPQQPTAPGSCANSGNTTICAGNPTAPTPPVAEVPSPPTQIQSSDGVQTADPTTGAPIYTQVPVYSTGGDTSSGAKAGDSTPSGSVGGKPASGSSSGSPASGSSSGGSGSYGGGVDCKTPPACTGDAVECGAATTQWGTTCEINTDLAGTGQPSDLSTLESKYGQGDVWTTPSTGNTVGDSANAGHYDSTGFGYGTTCPAVDVSADLMGQTVTAPLSLVCPFGALIRAIVIGFATVSAVMITWGGRNG